MKPLGQKAYGSIPHLPGSRRGAGDHGLTEQQARILTEKTRDKHDEVIVAEKLDGSNVCVARKGGGLIALGRAGYLAQSSPYKQHQLFAAWVRCHLELFGWLREGERVCCELMIQAHGTIYTPKFECPVVAFDVIMGRDRLLLDDWMPRCQLPAAKIIHRGPALPVDEALVLLGEHGYYGADMPEGAVWRVERKGVCNFLGKYVRPEKVDGKYLEKVTGNGPVWNVDYDSLHL